MILLLMNTANRFHLWISYLGHNDEPSQTTTTKSKVPFCYPHNFFWISSPFGSQHTSGNVEECCPTFRCDCFCKQRLSRSRRSTLKRLPISNVPSRHPSMAFEFLEKSLASKGARRLLPPTMLLPPSIQQYPSNVYSVMQPRYHVSPSLPNLFRMQTHQT